MASFPHLTSVAVACLLAGASTLPAAPPQMVLDGFEHEGLEAECRWRWMGFAKGVSDNANSPIKLAIVPAESGHELAANGALPNDGSATSWGGIYLRSPDGAAPADFSPWSALRFTAASSRPGYYAVRIEQQGIDHDSTNVTFPVDEHRQEIQIPLAEFKTGVRKSTRVVFVHYVDTPGAAFDLRLDDLQLVQVSEFVDFGARFSSWAPNRTIARQNARFHQQPILYYFCSPRVRPSTDFDKLLLADTEFANLARNFVLCRVNVAEETEFARSAGVYRLPSALIAEATTQGGTGFYTGADTSLLKKSMQEYLGTRAHPQPGSGGAATGDKYYTVLIDDFSDRNLLNEVGGSWGTFDAASSGAFLYRFVELGPGNIAIDVSGTFPQPTGGATWGGVYTDLASSRSQPRKLSNFEWVAFICRSDTPGKFEMRLEGVAPQTPATYAFTAGSTPGRVVIPISALGPVASQATTIVWTRPSPAPGDRFSLTIDDLMVIRER